MKYIILTLLLISPAFAEPVEPPAPTEPVAPPICTPAQEDDLIDELYHANTRNERKIYNLEQDVSVLKTRVSEIDDPVARRRRAIENLPPARKYPEVTPKPVDEAFRRPIKPAPEQFDGPKHD